MEQLLEEAFVLRQCLARDDFEQIPKVVGPAQSAIRPEVPAMRAAA